MSTLQPGQQIGRYRVVRPLGEGAMGEVYLAEDPQIERLLAIKTVRVEGKPQDLADRKARLLREAKTAGRLIHPHVVTLFDAGEQERILYLAFEFVDGSTLAERIESPPPLTLGEALRVVREVAEGLDFAHRQGIIHRDVKPTNLLLDRQGRVKISDFGIAKMIGQSTELTMTGTVVGSPHYLSPEQIRGEPLDGRSDLFSLGVVLYELLCRERPFNGDTLTTLVYQILHHEPPPLERVRPDLGPALDGLVRRMLAKDREQRLPNLGEVARGIAEIERGLAAEVLAGPAAPEEAPLDKTRRLESSGAPAAPPAAAAEPATAVTARVAPRQEAAATASVARPEPARRRARMWLAVAAGLIVVLGLTAAGGVWWWLRQRRGEGIERTAGGSAQVAGAPEQVAGAPEQAAAGDQVAGAPDQVAGAPDQAAGAPDPVAGASDPVAGAPDPGAPEAAAPAPDQEREVPSRPEQAPPPGGEPAEQPPATPPREQAPARPSSEQAPPPAVEPAPAPAPESVEGEAAEPQGSAGEVRPAPALPAARAARLAVDREMETGLTLDFQVEPEDAFILMRDPEASRGTLLGRAADQPTYTLPGAGEYYLMFRKEGMEEYRIHVHAEAAGPSRTPVAVRLRALGGGETRAGDLERHRVGRAVALRVRPPDAVVSVDGRRLGTARQIFGAGVGALRWRELAPGVHRVSVEAPGYVRHDFIVEVLPGAEPARQRIEVELRRERDS